MTNLDNIITGEKISFQWFIDLLKDILAKVFGFIAESEGWVEAE